MPAELKMTEAPPTVKFALWREPQAKQLGRQGGASVSADSHGRRAADARRIPGGQGISRTVAPLAAKNAGLPPRRDLELECIGEVLEGRRWIHCHSYRQDEILAFLRLMEEFEVRVGCLQHILEGYKVADAMARHGVSGSSFSHWWAYKFSSGAGRHSVQRPVRCTTPALSSRSIRTIANGSPPEPGGGQGGEIRRRAAPGKPEVRHAEPGQQLRIDQYVGSLEAGKHADFVVYELAPVELQQAGADRAHAASIDVVEDAKSRDTIPRHAFDAGAEDPEVG